MILAVVVAGGMIHWGVALILVPLGIWLARWVWRKLGIVLELSRRLRAAREAVPREPAADATDMQRVNWWGLLKAGFVPQEYDEAHEAPQWRLVGRPWRVLVKGSLRIPVFRKRRGKPKIYPQHRARLAAYCRLLELTEGGESPYGVVLFGNGYDGLTVPCSQENVQLFSSGLGAVRAFLHDVAAGGLMPDIPRPANVCHECPLGRPRAHRPGESETRLNGAELPAYRTRGEDGVLYHSICGDRFRWVPPHDRAAEKGLC